MNEPHAVDYRQHVELETPEHVMIDYEVAGIASRALASLFDWCIVFVLVLLCAVLFAVWRGPGAWGRALLVLVVYAITTGYFTFFEAFNHGQTPGKRSLGIRTIRDTGHGVTFAAAAIRNLLLPIDMLGMIGLVLIAVDRKGRRLGDLVAGTLVVRDRPFVVAAFTADAATTPGTDSDGGIPQLTDEEFHLLREFAGRVATLPPAVTARFASQLARRFADRMAQPARNDVAALLALSDDEMARRRSRFGGSARTGGRGAARAGAERLVARKQARWAEFQLIADRVAEGGLDRLSARELPDFAARYREVAADLARARTYGAEPIVLAALERLVAAGHNALYRSDSHGWRQTWHFFSRECPAAIVAARRYVALAGLVFVLPGVAGFAVLRAHPGLAPSVLPDVVLERAEAGVARRAAGLGYVEESSADRPMVAAAIITNNVGVAFRCFASGIVFGVGSLVALAFNGLELGAVSGHFANAGLLGYLWTFVIGHSALELFSIWVAGAAGFLLGRAVIAPGALPRRDALALAGRRAIRMVGGATVLLLFAGTIEGFVSSSGSSVAARIAVGVASLVFLGGYLWNGARNRVGNSNPPVP